MDEFESWTEVSQKSDPIHDLCYKSSLLLTPAITLNPVTTNAISHENLKS